MLVWLLTYAASAHGSVVYLGNARQCEEVCQHDGVHIRHMVEDADSPAQKPSMAIRDELMMCHAILRHARLAKGKTHA